MLVFDICKYMHTKQVRGIPWHAGVVCGVWSWCGSSGCSTGQKFVLLQIVAWSHELWCYWSWNWPILQYTCSKKPCPRICKMRSLCRVERENQCIANTDWIRGLLESASSAPRRSQEWSFWTGANCTFVQDRPSSRRLHDRRRWQEQIWLAHNRTSKQVVVSKTYKKKNHSKNYRCTMVPRWFNSPVQELARRAHRGQLDTNYTHRTIQDSPRAKRDWPVHKFWRSLW